MPLPKPKNKEKQDGWIERCMGNGQMKKDFPDNKQRLGVCFSIWRKEKEKKETDMKTEERKAIVVHHTPISDKAWDGPGNEARLKNDEKADYYKKAFAWQDPDADKETKSAYKFIHHEVSGDGKIEAANIRGCQTGIAVLNGARGGAKIPSGDRKGVWNHLAAHIKDADLEPAELKSLFDGEIERRAFPFSEVRIEERKNKTPKIIGHAAVFNVFSEELFGGVREKIEPGAFKKTISEADVRALWNHDPNFVLGRNKSGTLKLKEDDVGLKIEIDPPDTTWAKDLVTTIKRGDVDQMSFGFQVVQEKWDGQDTNSPIRTLLEVKLFDVSPVTYPAYPDTDVGIRSALAKIGIDFEGLSKIITRTQYGIAISDSEKKAISDIILILNDFIKPVQEDHLEKEEGYRIGILRKRLELAEKM